MTAYKIIVQGGYMSGDMFGVAAAMLLDPTVCVAILQGTGEEYLAVLDDQTARLKAIEFHECQTDRDVVLLGAVDLNVTMRKMLDQVADRVTALIFAPEDWQSRFDEHGCRQVWKGGGFIHRRSGEPAGTLELGCFS